MSLTDSLWNSAQSLAELPSGASSGESLASLPDDCLSRRGFHRFLVNRRAILVRSRNTHGIYVRDMSKGGIGFFAPFQLFPNEVAWLLLPEEDKKLQIRVRRCRRNRSQCYEIGALFVGGDMILPGDLSELMGSGI